MITLFLADDRPVVLEGLKRIVAGSPDMCVVGEAATRATLLDTIWTAEPDVLLLNLSVAGPAISALLRSLKKERPGLRVLVLGVEGDYRHVFEVLGTGAAGYLTTDHSPGELVAAIRRVVHGATFVSPALAQKLALSRRAVSEPPRHEALSNREYQVLCMFGSGRAFSDIAAELGLSRQTVSSYRNRVLQKLHLTTNVDLIRYVLENRLVV
jgi:two-component system, NarL family, invasion response regulator UvrY